MIWYLHNCLYVQKTTAVQFSFASLKLEEDRGGNPHKRKKNKIWEPLWVSKKFGWDNMLQYDFFLMVAYDESVYMHIIYILF